MPQQENDTSPPTVRDRAPKPPGVLPKNVQAWVLIGVATVMVCVLAFSGGQSPSPGRTDPLAEDDVEQFFGSALTLLRIDGTEE